MARQSPLQFITLPFLAFVALLALSLVTGQTITVTSTSTICGSAPFSSIPTVVVTSTTTILPDAASSSSSVDPGASPSGIVVDSDSNGNSSRVGDYNSQGNNCSTGTPFCCSPDGNGLHNCEESTTDCQQIVICCNNNNGKQVCLGNVQLTLPNISLNVPVTINVNLKKRNLFEIE
ncbi:hypothetical protein BT63DRAFT_461186 [Microthyrium microscopicum]|uniref:Hydrophobin n=1 Tax=Microthyrium microscopicum TaxID=703497 RepID=A0A6A6TUN3_9PEZI|nr:hypothetical protein BT63DRAFT_461186 [Microthyrium microscopicum]